MILRVDLFYHALKPAVLVKDECPAQCAGSRLPIHLLLAPCAERLKHLYGRVREQDERKAVLVAELLVGSRAVLAHPHDIVPGLRQGGIIVPETACLRRAPRGIVLRVEIYYVMVFFPSRSDDLTVLPSWSMTSKSGILSPGCNMIRFLYYTELVSLYWCKDIEDFSYICRLNRN